MNIFVLCAGRTGSTTFIRACQHITNYTAAHESRSRLVGAERFRYPPNHIEADNRLSWMLGRLYAAYGDDALYIHLTRNIDDVAKSHVRRYHHKSSIFRAYHRNILMEAQPHTSLLAVAYDYCETVNRNIEFFIKDRPHTMSIALEQITTQFPQFWERINAQGDFAAAMSEWSVRHNQNPVPKDMKAKLRAKLRSYRLRIARVLYD